MNNKNAFTVIELIVSMAIISFMLSVVLYNYGNFNDNLSVSAATQEMSVIVRQSQAYGINVKEGGVGTGQFNYAYGMYFSSQSPTSYYIFVDSNSNNKYDVGSGCGSGSTECVEKIDLRNGVTISSVCDSASCPPVGVTSLHITFLRPNPDARIYLANSSNTITSGPLSVGKVKLTSTKGTAKYVIIESTGQITIQ